ncbi:hypothetical protein KA107_02630 [Candidatus Pacearchaeota archaeon]|nr:hypothetical protein [Candidatus Pacearchaeota archaeon]
MSFEYDFFLETPSYGAKIATAYQRFMNDNPLKERPAMRDRAAYLNDFCKTVGLNGQTVFFEVEEAREQQVLAIARRSAMVAIMVRGGTVATTPSLRKNIEGRIRDHESS